MEEFSLGLTRAAAREALLFVDGEEKERRWFLVRRRMTEQRKQGSEAELV